jgi:hypothetical protein
MRTWYESKDGEYYINQEVFTAANFQKNSQRRQNEAQDRQEYSLELAPFQDYKPSMNNSYAFTMRGNQFCRLENKVKAARKLRASVELRASFPAHFLMVCSVPGTNLVTLHK